MTDLFLIDMSTESSLFTWRLVFGKPANEVEINHGRVPRQTHSTYCAFGAVGFIDWLDEQVRKFKCRSDSGSCNHLLLVNVNADASVVCGVVPHRNRRTGLELRHIQSRDQTLRLCAERGSLRGMHLQLQPCDGIVVMVIPLSQILRTVAFAGCPVFRNSRTWLIPLKLSAIIHPELRKSTDSAATSPCRMKRIFMFQFFCGHRL